ncbi:MAG: hypothetical protein E6Q97_25680 [Desulfurellales bacterium]|nr:MAG: hypothetical protein E6Q97_25680 [Desulfurellales bacterium]
MRSTPDRGDSGIQGANPCEWFGTDAPDGDRGYWADAPLGSLYIQKASNNGTQKTFTKVKNSQRDDDWVQGLHCLSVTITRAMMTDGGVASGTYVIAEQIPVGAWVLQAKLVNVTGFTGNGSAVITVGDGSDVDRYNTGTPSVYTTEAAIDLGVPSGTKIHATAATITVTISGGSDFTAISAGQLTLQIYYLN